MEHRTKELDEILENMRPEDIDGYLENYEKDLASSNRPFAVYMRERFRERDFTQQEVFRRADIPEKYGYRLISQEKRTTQRDYILRFCIAAQFTLDETQRALKLYGMSELYARIPRDAVLMIAFNRSMFDTDRVDDLLRDHGMEPLKTCAHQE